MSRLPRWAKQLGKARSLKKIASVSLYRRVRLIADIMCDSTFLRWAESNNIDPIEWANTELSDVPADYQSLVGLLDAFPDCESWVRHDLWDLLYVQNSDDRKAYFAEMRKGIVQIQREFADLKETMRRAKSGS